MTAKKNFYKIAYTQNDSISVAGNLFAIRVTSQVFRGWPKFDRDVNIIWHSTAGDVTGPATAFTYESGNNNRFVQVLTLKVTDFPTLSQLGATDQVYITVL